MSLGQLAASCLCKSCARVEKIEMRDSLKEEKQFIENRALISYSK